MAMMLPSAAPALLLFAGLARARASANASLRVAAMAAGYLLAWGGFSLAATGLQWGLETARAEQCALRPLDKSSSKMTLRIRLCVF